jgi:large subunit ribosomal protein L10
VINQVTGVHFVPIGLKEKQAIIAEVNATASNALSAVMADYRGVSVAGMTQLRKDAREAGVQVRVIRNTLAKLAFKGTEFECLSEVLLGPNVIAFSLEDPGAAARIFKDFAKTNDKFEIKALSVGGKLLPADQIDALAKLPTRDQALALLMMVMLEPVAKLAKTLNDVPAKVTRVVAAVRDQKQEAA